ncbi:hypothetical protein [Flagellimonas allohymeniacidonis]|uniref:KAP NTPase domain-containing protein n=1 Tax=Flagellimonas allohymeniacidonis TaxID=2517819 RepID=A0A4Q8QEE9_9FLAO|nr:hypothetical protein [Allomuricauda hymeniacidonis]TAI48882.1 hypothetical protein EW142_03535 [Allomuricauda hymeniacidonis]
MTEDLTKRITQFLEIDTNYAVIISGDYGIGKTFYFKNKLFPLVRNINVPNSESEEKYRPILISLFGIKSVEEIQKQIFLELFPLLKNKGVKIASDIGKSLLKVFSGVDIEQYVNDADTSTSDIINYNKLLLCFDDIDRKSDDLQIKELFGFINNLVENSNTKVIIIANEDVLRKEESNNDEDTYSVIREKVIGISIKFNTDVVSIYGQIINSKYKDSLPVYFNYLKDYNQSIIARIEQNNKNIRNLVFFLEHYKIIFNSLDEYLKPDDNLNPFRKEIFELILNFTLPISIEYKMGSLKPKYFKDIKDLHIGGLFDLSAFLSDGPSMKIKSKEEKVETYQEIYKRKYLDDTVQRKKVFFESIFNYITGSSSFSIDKLIEELKSIFVIEDNKVPKREKVLNTLSYWQCIDLNTNEYRKLTNEMLKFVDTGEYKLDQYPTVFHYATRFNNLLNYNLENLKKRFKRGIKKGTFEYKPSLHFHLHISANTEFYEDLKEVAEYCIQINKEIKVKSEKEEVENLFELFQNNFKEFLEKVNESNTELRYKPIFAKFNFNKFWSTLKKAKNTELIEFGFDMARRYTKYVYPDLNPEKYFLEQLKEKLESEIGKSRTTKMDNIAYEFLVSKINESINNFE